MKFKKMLKFSSVLATTVLFGFTPIFALASCASSSESSSDSENASKANENKKANDNSSSDSENASKANENKKANDNSSSDSENASKANENKKANDNSSSDSENASKANENKEKDDKKVVLNIEKSFYSQEPPGYTLTARNYYYNIGLFDFDWITEYVKENYKDKAVVLEINSLQDALPYVKWFNDDGTPIKYEINININPDWYAVSGDYADITNYHFTNGYPDNDKEKGKYSGDLDNRWRKMNFGSNFSIFLSKKENNNSYGFSDFKMYMNIPDSDGFIRANLRINSDFFELDMGIPFSQGFYLGECYLTFSVGVDHNYVTESGNSIENEYHINLSWAPYSKERVYGSEPNFHIVDKTEKYFGNNVKHRYVKFSDEFLKKGWDKGKFWRVGYFSGKATLKEAK